MSPPGRRFAELALSSALHAAVLVGLPAIAWRTEEEPDAMSLRTRDGLGEGEHTNLVEDGLPGMPRPQLNPAAEGKVRLRVLLAAAQRQTPTAEEAAARSIARAQSSTRPASAAVREQRRSPERSAPASEPRSAQAAEVRGGQASEVPTVEITAPPAIANNAAGGASTRSLPQAAARAEAVAIQSSPQQAATRAEAGAISPSAPQGGIQTEAGALPPSPQAVATRAEAIASPPAAARGTRLAQQPPSATSEPGEAVPTLLTLPSSESLPTASALLASAHSARQPSATSRPTPPSSTSPQSSPLQELPRHASPSKLPVGDGMGPGQDRMEPGGGRNLLPLVQARISWVARLVSPSVVQRARAEGTARVSLSVNGDGYVQGMRILQPTGSAILDEEIESTVHFAEPFPVWDGWLTVTVDYRRHDPAPAALP